MVYNQANTKDLYKEIEEIEARATYTSVYLASIDIFFNITYKIDLSSVSN